LISKREEVKRKMDGRGGKRAEEVEVGMDWIRERRQTKGRYQNAIDECRG